jgi:glutathione S-transferase
MEEGTYISSMAYTLHVGEKRYSSWSARPWLLMRGLGIPFTERVVSLQPDAGKAGRFEQLPGGRVPMLEDGPVQVWDSLAIVEYLAERHPGVWPADPVARAFARSACAEMHGGFQALRSQLSMDLAARRPQRRRNDAVKADIARIEALWSEARRRFGHGGPFLFGAFSAADAYFAPVAFRFQTYGVAPAGAAGEVLKALLGHPAVKAWEAAGITEPLLADHDLDLMYPDDTP